MSRYLWLSVYEESVESRIFAADINDLLREKKCTVKVLETQDKWFGVTYKEDKKAVVHNFWKLIEDGIYEEELYRNLFPH